MSISPSARMVGVGSPIMDLLAEVPESFVAGIDGAKGGMELVDEQAMTALVEQLTAQPGTAAGGSAANTTFAVAKLGLPSAFLGKLGEDAAAAVYEAEFAARGGDVSRFKRTPAAPTARCLSLITPDSQRTLRTNLGAAMLMAPEDINAADFDGYGHAHIEGYLLFNRALAEKALSAAKASGCTVSLDLGSFEVVGAAKDILPGLLRDYVDAVFANEDEAEAFCGHKDPEAALTELGALCETAAVKVGPKGAFLKRGGDVCFAPAVILPARNVRDTTGAGDLWAAGFLYGHLQGRPLDVCGKMGAILGAEVVQCIGAQLDEACWERVKAQFAAL